MRALSAADVLRVWEHGQASGLAARAIALLEAANPGDAGVLDLPIGRRDALLLELRERTFGGRLDAIAACPACRDTIEFEFTTDDVRMSPPVSDDTVRIEAGGHQLAFRLPTTRDLAALPGDMTVDGARHWLLARCAIGELPSVPLPDDVVETVSGQLGEADPQADVRVELHCPACDHAWSAPFDIVTFFWRELQTYAQRLLREVHVLAARYAWTEADVLALSPLRRRAYLELATT
jgi:hypothetical protein